MSGTHQELYPQADAPFFKLGQEVTIRELRSVVAPQNTFDRVEEARLKMVANDVNELLRDDLPAGEVSLHTNSLYNLGAEAVLACLPEERGGVV